MKPDVDAWDPWRPEQVQELLAGCEAAWSVAAGWALDLHHGRQTREHSDLEIGLPRRDFALLRRYLEKYDLYAVKVGAVDPLTPENLTEGGRFGSVTAMSGGWTASSSRATPPPGSATGIPA